MTVPPATSPAAVPTPATAPTPAAAPDGGGFDQALLLALGSATARPDPKAPADELSEPAETPAAGLPDGNPLPLEWGGSLPLPPLEHRPDEDPTATLEVAVDGQWVADWLSPPAPGAVPPPRAAGESRAAGAVPGPTSFEGLSPPPASDVVFASAGAPAASPSPAPGATPPADTAAAADPTAATELAPPAGPGGAGESAPRGVVAPPPPEPGLALHRPVDHPNWGQDLGERVLWLAKGGQQQAELRLNPPHLGMLEIRISVHQDQSASFSFHAGQQGAREAIEAALPRLREMLADNGFAMVDVHVSGGAARERNGPWPGAPGQPGGPPKEPGAATDTGTEANAPLLTRSGRSLVDLFA